MLKATGVLAKHLSLEERDFLEHACEAISRLLPHVDVSQWQEDAWGKTEAVWSTSSRSEIRISIGIRPRNYSAGRLIRCAVRRKKDKKFSTSVAGASLDSREHAICGLIAVQVNAILGNGAAYPENSLPAIRREFDETIVAKQIAEHHGFQFDLSEILSVMHALSGQTYENKQVSFGCVIDPGLALSEGPDFPRSYTEAKKFRALSDGFRTAYVVSRFGKLVRFVDLEQYTTQELTEKHHYPEWSRLIARASRNKKCGIALSRQGDILVFDDGALRFTYRFGRWLYWNHAHLKNLLRDLARAPSANKIVTGNVVGSIYRAALDVAFRRTGSLFVIAHNRRKVPDFVRRGDEVGGEGKSDIERYFEKNLMGARIQNIPRTVLVELASLDGAIVVSNSGELLAYGAVLSPKKFGRGRLKGAEGSRTKAAIGASTYGVSVKVSSDGDITIYHKNKQYLKV